MPFCRNHPEVIQVGLGKSGTSTVQKYFTDRFDSNATCGALLPNIIQADVDARAPALARARALCPHFYISELARVYWPHESIQLQLTHLRELRLAAPSALFVHCERSPAKWVSSVRRWNTLQARFAQRDLEGLPKGVGRTEQELANWYTGVNSYLRLAFAYRTNYVRVDVDDPASLRALETFCGTRATPYAWVPVNVNPRTDDRSRALKANSTKPAF